MVGVGERERETKGIIGVIISVHIRTRGEEKLFFSVMFAVLVSGCLVAGRWTFPLFGTRFCITESV